MAQAMDAFRPDVPNTARMYDYYLGGKDNYPADRAAAERVIALLPAGVVRMSAAANREFLLRVVRHLAEDLDVRQFLDIGAGLPTMNSVHQVAQSIAPESRIVYVDHDPIVLAHSRNLLHGNDRTAIIQRDLRDPAGILADQELHALLDLSQPVAVLLVAVLHFLADADDPYGIVKALMDPLPPGSYLVISHFTADSYAQADVAAREYQNATSALHSRTWTQAGRFFTDCRLIPPFAAHPGRSLFWCGVGEKTGPARGEALPALDGAEASGAASASTLTPGGADATASGATSNTVTLRPDIPNVARMYDYMLGGKDNYPADREAARRTFAVLGEDIVRGTVLQNRQFLGRAVRYLAADQGIRQFLDIGTGLPSMNSVHAITQAVAPDSQVVYVDNDPVVLAHARDLLNGVPGTSIVDHDLRDPAAISGDARIRSVLDFDQPIAVLLVAVLHFLADADDPAGTVATLMAAMPPGSCLAISHLTADYYPHAVLAADVYNDTTPGLHLRSRAEIETFFCGLPLLPPGELTYTGDWHPDQDTAPPTAPGGSSSWCGIARK